MKFMLMMHGTKQGWESLSSWPPADFKRHIEFMIDFDKRLAKRGELVLAEGLDIPANAKVVRAQQGGPPITDGPFPEAKEFLAGFWIVECKSAARAVEIAAEASAAPGIGGAPMSIPIEIRQVMNAPDV
jgi:hypothetical protein